MGPIEETKEPQSFREFLFASDEPVKTKGQLRFAYFLLGMPFVLSALSIRQLVIHHRAPSLIVTGVIIDAVILTLYFISIRKSLAKFGYRQHDPGICVMLLVWLIWLVPTNPTMFKDLQNDSAALAIVFSVGPLTALGVIVTLLRPVICHRPYSSGYSSPPRAPSS